MYGWETEDEEDIWDIDLEICSFEKLDHYLQMINLNCREQSGPSVDGGFIQVQIYPFKKF